MQEVLEAAYLSLRHEPRTNRQNACPPIASCLDGPLGTGSRQCLGILFLGPRSPGSPCHGRMGRPANHSSHQSIAATPISEHLPSCGHLRGPGYDGIFSVAAVSGRKHGRGCRQVRPARWKSRRAHPISSPWQDRGLAEPRRTYDRNIRAGKSITRSQKSSGVEVEEQNCADRNVFVPVS